MSGWAAIYAANRQQRDQGEYQRGHTTAQRMTPGSLGRLYHTYTHLSIISILLKPDDQRMKPHLDCAVGCACAPLSSWERSWE